MKRAIFCFAVLFAATVLTAANAIAQKQPARKPLTQGKKQPCAKPMTQSELNRCAEDEYKKADAELNQVYQQLTAKLEPDHLERLRIAQRAWITFRDAHCDYEAFAFTGGSIQPLIHFTCLDATTRERTKHLRASLKEVSR